MLLFMAQTQEIKVEGVLAKCGGNSYPVTVKHTRYGWVLAIECNMGAWGQWTFESFARRPIPTVLSIQGAFVCENFREVYEAARATFDQQVGKVIPFLTVRS